jgi:hypothetical protein
MPAATPAPTRTNYLAQNHAQRNPHAVTPYRPTDANNVAKPTSLDRYGRVDEIAAMVAFVTGANLTVDGGMNA